MKVHISRIHKAIIFGNKGNLWAENAHCYLNGENLCKTPALSTNWCRIERVEEIGCEKCLQIINEQKLASHEDDILQSL